MSKCAILVLADGPHEMGPPLSWDQPLPLDDDLPALPRLVHRLLDEPPWAEFTCLKFAHTARKHGKGPSQSISRYASSKYAMNAVGAIVKAGKAGFRGVVILIDRDRGKTMQTLQPLKEGRDSVCHSGYPPCAVGCAVEAFDAWMICDGKAIDIAGGDSSKSHPNPENLKGKKDSSREHPKNRAAELFGVSVKNIPASKYATVALHVDIKLLERCCPKGFKPFADEVRERILPLVSS